jgi:hypothetical protein
LIAWGFLLRVHAGYCSNRSITQFSAHKED